MVNQPKARVLLGALPVPWNVQPGDGRLGKGITKSDFRASADERIDRVSCVYPAQDFEFDYVGVIFGPHLVYRLIDSGRVGQPKESHDRFVSREVTTGAFTDFVKKSIHRVLLARGVRGCHVLFVGIPTRDILIDRTERREPLGVSTNLHIERRE